jgi:rubrerythrin
MTSRDCFQLAERIELLARDLYAELASHPGTGPSVRQLLLRLADEEEHHAQRIRLVARTQRRAQWTDEKLPLIAGDLQAVAREQEALLRRARTQRLPSDFPGIFDELVAMEVRFSFVHAEELTEAAEPEVGRFFAALARQDGWHRQLLQKARPALATPAPHRVEPA